MNIQCIQYNRGAIHASSWQFRAAAPHTDSGREIPPQGATGTEKFNQKSGEAPADKSTRWRRTPRCHPRLCPASSCRGPGPGPPDGPSPFAGPGLARGASLPPPQPPGSAAAHSGPAEAPAEGPGRAAPGRAEPPRPCGTGPRRGAAAARRSPGPAPGPVRRSPARRGWPRKARPYLPAARRAGDLAGRTTAASGGRPGPCSARPGREAKAGGQRPGAKGALLHRHRALEGGQGAAGSGHRPLARRRLVLGPL